VYRDAGRGFVRGYDSSIARINVRGVTIDPSALVIDDPWRLSVLRAVRALHLPDAAVGAGFVRNAVWDRLHGYETAAPADVDVLYFDSSDASPARERALERRLAWAMADVPWSVRNQARMHLRNGDAPYRDTEDAMRHWLETATSVALQLEHDDSVTVMAPFGVEDLMALRSAPTPRGRQRIDAYRARMREKAWWVRWPRVRIEGL
jgi:hypothetical protein